MDNLLASIPGVAVYLDDISVTGVTELEHLKSLEEVLRRLGQSGLRVKKKNVYSWYHQYSFWSIR